MENNRMILMGWSRISLIRGETIDSIINKNKTYRARKWEIN